MDESRGRPSSSNLGATAASSCSSICACVGCAAFFRRLKTSSGLSTPLSPALILNSCSAHSSALANISRKSWNVESSAMLLKRHTVLKHRYQRDIRTARPVPRNKPCSGRSSTRRWREERNEGQTTKSKNEQTVHLVSDSACLLACFVFA